MITTPGPVPTRAAGHLVAWLSFVVVSIVGLEAAGGPLPSPPLTRPQHLDAWLDPLQPADAAFAVLRLLALGLAWYLLAVTLVGAAVRLTRSPTLVRGADLVTAPSIRRVLNAAAGISVAVTLSGPAGAAAGGTAQPAPPADGAVTTVPAVPSEALTPQAGWSGNGGDDLPTLRRLPDDVLPEPDPLPTPGSPARQWEVRPGQHFWSVAEALLVSAWQQAPSDAEIDPYWRALVSANRSILRDPDNPDLLYPGQILTIPPAPQAG